MSANARCPDAAAWGRFLVGLVPEEEAAALEIHLAGCPSCLTDIGQSQADDDAVLNSCRSLRRQADSAPDLAQLEVLVARLQELVRLPSRIGRYRVIRLLGQGGMGKVYLAEDAELQRQVAVKVPRLSGAQDERERTQFLQEARAAAAVRHPHVCPIHDVGIDQDTHYLVMAHIQGESLAERLKRVGAFADQRLAARLALQIAEGLAAVHARGIIHRDLKPGNILLDESGQALLTDFGLARPTFRNETSTSPDMVAGTPAYMAPEQVCVELGEPSPRTDVYSLGVVLYEMLTGRLPFQGTKAQVLVQLAVQSPQSLEQWRGDVDPALKAIVGRALARRPAERFASAEELGEALRAWLDGGAPISPKSSSPARSRRRLLAGVLFLVLVVGLLATFFRQPGQSRLTPLPTSSAESPVVGFRGWIDVTLWDDANPERRGLKLADAGALPIKEHDAIRIDARLNRPGYLYVIWIDSDGRAEPVYPWKPGKWPERPAEEVPSQTLSLPTASGAGWPMGAGTPGMETLLLLVRATPLPRDTDLAKLLKDLPQQNRQNARAAVWFENGNVVSGKTERERAPRFFDERQIDDPVLRTQQLLKTTLAPLCDYSRAVCFSRQ
jgi:serine/threonine protein kinase